MLKREFLSWDALLLHHNKNHHTSWDCLVQILYRDTYFDIFLLLSNPDIFSRKIILAVFEGKLIMFNSRLDNNSYYKTTG